MDEVSCALLSEERIDSLYPVFFGVSCAFLALNLLPHPETQNKQFSEERNNVVKGGAHLLGMYLWKVQTKGVQSQNLDLLRKLEDAEKRIEELKRRRSDESKANERVMSIVAAREQSWFNERKMLRQQIGSLDNELRVVEAKSERSVFGLKEYDNLLHEKDRLIDGIETKVRAAEIQVDELTEKAELEAEHHCSEILRYKTATIELVSSQRQLEAELNRALRRLEAAKEEIDSVIEQKEQAVVMNQRLSSDLVNMRKDLEHKDQVLYLLLRKSELGASEKQIVLKQVKPTKAKRNQENGMLKSVSETKNERHLFRNLLSKHVKGYHHPPELRRELEVVSVVSDCHFIEGTEEEQRHNLVIEAFVEQLRLKDERIEALQWRSLSSDMETKRLRSYVQGLEHDFAQLRQENFKLQSLIVDHENELQSVKEKLKSLNPPNLRKLEFNPYPDEETINLGMLRISDESINDNVKDIVLDVQYHQQKVENYTCSSSINHSRHMSIDTNDFTGAETTKEFNYSTRKMDIHALGVTHKIKRLKQQLLLLERFKGKQECSENDEFAAFVSLVNKQVDRYQSLQCKTDDLSQRMQDNNLNLNSECSTTARSPEETKILEQFLEETFQIQRYIVATGQKLTQVQAKIASGLQGEDGKIEKLADNMKTLFREVQMGLEIRISRIIGNLEGTLACNGIMHLKK